MQLRWRIGLYLGVASHSGEHYVGTWNGDVVRTLSLVRIVEKSRWKSDLYDKLLGTPAKPVPSGLDAYERVEECDDPHAMIDAEADDSDKRKFAEAINKRIRITQADLKKYGYTDECPRCEPIKAGNHATDKNQREWCRIRIYGEWEQAGDPKRLQL